MPLALNKLANFLVEIHRQNKKWAGAKGRPLILLAERPSNYLVMGVTCQEVAGDGKNRFGKVCRASLSSTPLFT